MCVLYVNLRSKFQTFGCVTMGSAVLFILRSRLLLYSAGSGLNRVQVVCMFILSKALFISSAIVGAILLNPFATVLFNVCSVVTVERCVL